MIRKTLLLLILVGISNNSIAKPTNDIGENTIEDAGYNYRVQYGAQMLSYMNLSVQPCDDFYEYACGNWKNTIKGRPSNGPRVNIEEITFQLSDVVELILQRSDITDVAPEYASEFEMAKKFYHNCLESDLNAMRKSSEFLKIIQSIGGFPAVDAKWNPSIFSWFNMSAHLNNYGAVSLLKEDINTHYPFAPTFPLSNYGFDIELHHDTIANTSSNAYLLNKNRMHTILAAYDVSKEKSEKIITDIFEFLSALIGMDKQYLESEETCEEMNKSVDIAAIEETRERFDAYYEIAWMGKFKNITDGDIHCIKYYYDLNKICEEHKEAAANYLSMQFLYHMDARLEDPKYQKDYCSAEMLNSLQYFFDYLFMKIYFEQDAADEVISMSKEIRQSIRVLLQKTDWLDESTRDAALLKEGFIKVNVGRYGDSETERMLLDQLKNLIYVEHNYDANKLNLAKFKIDIDRFYGLHQEDFSNKTKPLESLKAMVANAFYYMLDNTMYIPAGVLQPPGYHLHWPRSLKFGTLGFILGHELGHGFDTIGRHYDHEGNQNNWWSDGAKEIYEKRVQCFVDHYNDYVVPEIHRNINGKKTNGENLADATALVTAYMAYKRYVDVESKTFESAAAFQKHEQMPGLDISPDQLFFVGAAQLWCSDYKEAHYWTLLRDYHTIDKYRVLGMVSNNNDFAKVFNCSVGDKMNPSVDKCFVW